MKANYKIAIVGLFVLLLTLFVTVETYALFETNANGDTEFDMGNSFK